MAAPLVPGDRSMSVKAVACTFGILAWISVSLRSYVRLKIVKFFGWDDGLMVIALVFYTTLSVCMVTAGFYGTGQHEANLSAEHIIIAKRLWWICEISYALASMAAKASICIFLLRITFRQIHRWILYSVMATTVLTCIVFMLILLLQCRPIAYFWDKSLPGGSCIPWNVVIAMSWLWSVFAGICDFTVGILPIFLVWNLQMGTRTKFMVAGILSVACIASSATIVRMPFLHTFADPDWLWATTDIALWTDIELGLGIFASCMATLRPLLRVVRNTSNHSGHQNFDRLQPNNLPFDRNFVCQNDSIRKNQQQNLGITLTTVHSTAREDVGDGNDSNDYLNQLSRVENLKQVYMVQKTFEVREESTPFERV